MKITYVEKNFRAEALDLINKANTIIESYQAQGFDLTLRQLYYQFVARGFIENSEKSYNKIGLLVSDGRRAGLIDWDAIVDRTRFEKKLPAWDSPKDLLSAAKDSYHVDLWASQQSRIAIWIEKDALSGVISSVCEDNDIPYFACRGYVSDSEMFNSAIRTLKFNKASQNLIVLHLGDHDPSGVDMTRDIKERLNLFSFNQAKVEVRRIALNMPQIEELQPPPNFAKITDTRCNQYIAAYGDKSWELDALEPAYIINLIKQQITDIRDGDKWQAALDKQEEERNQIADMINKLEVNKNGNQ